mmetsp:Transcript_10071/g.15052  ORF Transcript_10071/g.15052 Transcript_10071/m.15052 type:complete len:103 (-) Transcript_10071:299-607(-)
MKLILFTVLVLSHVLLAQDTQLPKAVFSKNSMRLSDLSAPKDQVAYNQYVLDREGRRINLQKQESQRQERWPFFQLTGYTLSVVMSLLGGGLIYYYYKHKPN